MTNTLDVDALRKTIEKDLQILKNAGSAYSIVSSDSILFEKGFGFRNLAEKLPFTPKTIFPLGSHTKMFTAHAIAMLVDQGKLAWDTPLKDFIPQFKMIDSFASEKMTLIDLLSHTTGLPHHQVMYMNAEWSYEQVFEKLPYLESFTEFRKQFKYANLNFMIATKIIEDISGENYFKFMERNIFKPLGMKSTNFSVDETFKTDDYSLGYRITDDGFGEEEYPDIKIQAGSMNSNLEDMNKWMQFLLNKGKIKDKQLISEKTLSKLYTAQRLDNNPFAMIIPDKNYIQSYGFALGCWNLNYRGTTIIQHYGTGPGITFNGGFMPELDIGFVLFSNTSGSDMPFIVNFHIADQILGLDVVDWGGKIKEFSEKMAQMQAERSSQMKDPQKQKTKPSRPLNEFVGVYTHPGYGDLEFSFEDSKLKVNYGKGSDVEVTHYHFDTFTLNIKTLGGFGTKKLVSFRDNFQGEITHLEMDAEPMVKPTRFEKKI
ncbi:MAG: serine hydrolase [Candidatus Heimdallarchaeota archaeon]